MLYKRVLRIIVALAICLAVPLAIAQSGDRVTRIGYLSLAPGSSVRSEALRDGLRELGYVESKNLVIVYKWPPAARSDRQSTACL
jgi:putative ABC transport system substrate-binding protein